MAAFGPTAKAGIGAARGCATFAGDLFQILRTDGIADTDNHANLLKGEIAQMIIGRNRNSVAVANLLRLAPCKAAPQPLRRSQRESALPQRRADRKSTRLNSSH